MRSSAVRLVAIALAASGLLAAAGTAAELWRFGRTGAGSAARLERDVRDRVAQRARDVRSLGERVSRDTAATVAAAAGQSDSLPRLFDQLAAIASASQSADPGASATVTVYVRQPQGQYRILAWSEGPAENVYADRLAGGATLFAAPGTLGLLLVDIQPIVWNGQRVGVAASQTVLAPETGLGQQGTYQLDSRFGPVTLRYPGGAVESRADGFGITLPGGPPVDVQISPRALHDARAMYRRRALSVAAVPLLAALLLLTGPMLRRRAEDRRATSFIRWSIAPSVLVICAGAIGIALCRWVDASSSAVLAGEALTTLALVGIWPMAWWWRRPHRLRAAHSPARFAVEQLLAGVALAATVWLTNRLLEQWITADTLQEWQLPLVPFRASGALYTAGLFIAELALYWTGAMVLAVMAGRWRISARQPGSMVAAVALWLLPLVLLIISPRAGAPLPTMAVLVVAGAAILFALSANAVRRRYRRTTQAMRLVVLYAALLVPVIAAYPLAWERAHAVAHAIVASNYAVATARRPDDTLTVVTRVREEVDAIPTDRLRRLLMPATSEAGVVPALPAFDVWTQTSLAKTRLTAAIELFDATGVLVSRFALNMPRYQAAAEAVADSPPSGCSWDVFGEAVPFASDERDMLHARRQVCDANGRPYGAIAVHVVNDYATLPFISTPNPYPDVIRYPETPRGSIIPDLQVVVYGWSLTPLFTSGSVAWPIGPDLFTRLYRSRQPFWVNLPAEGHPFEVYFSNDSRFIYALGYPASSWFDHLTRVSEAATLMAIVFVLMVLAAALYAPFVRPRAAPLHRLLDEIRTSFYRKLFLFFLLAAIAPVLMFGIAFGVYMTTRFRADVENEASTIVAVTRRVVEQTMNAQPQQVPITDDLMVWIGQMIHQDVDVFERSELVATSQRDLYASGLLPTRTPAAVYRSVVLDRLPSFVGDEFLGSFSYVIAAAPLPGVGREFVLSVPLASRQREIERQINELYRGVLVGGVFVVLFAAALGASVASRVSDPVARLSRATRQITAGSLDIRLVADTADELSRLIADFNTMAATLSAQRDELARSHQLQAWAEMARQVAHEIKNPLTPIQLAAEHLQHVHADRHHPLGPVFDQCVSTILRQVRLLRQIASEFSTFAGRPTPRMEAVSIDQLLDEIVLPYRAGLDARTTIVVAAPAELPQVYVDRTLIARAFTNLVENAVQAMPDGGTLRITATAREAGVAITFEDTGVGMEADAAARAFEPYFSTKTAGSGLGLANARRNIEICGGTIELSSVPREGTTFVVTLPRAEPSRGAPAASSTPGR